MKTSGENFRAKSGILLLEAQETLKIFVHE